MNFTALTKNEMTSIKGGIVLDKLKYLASIISEAVPDPDEERKEEKVTILKSRIISEAVPDPDEE